MQVFDSHVHIVVPEWLSPQAVASMSSLAPDFARRLEIQAEPARLRAFLEADGIEGAFIIMSWHDLRPAGRDTNLYLAEYCRREADFFVPIAYLEPLTIPDPAELLEDLVVNYGMRGLKLHPPSGFYPNDSRLYPLYAKAAELNIPVFLHIGSSTLPGMRLKYARPIYLDDVAVDFPDLTIIMIHAGRGYDYEAAFCLARLHPNMILDITGLPPNRLLQYFPELERLAERVLFGSDWPTFPATPGSNAAAIRNLPLAESSITMILRENARRLMARHNMSGSLLNFS